MLNNVSVIIPVYNAEKYLEKAVDSALLQPEVGEVILIEDKSPDDCLALCQKLKTKHEKVKLLQHPDKKNHGAGASRNLGIENATCNYIAFLDADDFYLPNRFKIDFDVFNNSHDTDGVYNAIGAEYYDEKSKERYNKIGINYLTTISKHTFSKELPFVILGISFKANGYFSLDGLTLKRHILKGIDLFDVELKNCQDTEFIFRLSYLLNLRPGNITQPVALRGVHGDNRTTIKNMLKYQPLTFRKMNDFISNQDGNRLLSSACQYYRTVSLFKDAFSNKKHVTSLLLSCNLLFNTIFYPLYLRKILLKIVKTAGIIITALILFLYLIPSFFKQYLESII